MSKLNKSICCASFVALLAFLAKGLVLLLLPFPFAEPECGELPACTDYFVKKLEDLTAKKVRIAVTAEEKASGRLKPKTVAAIHKKIDTIGFAIIDGVLGQDLVNELRRDIFHEIKLGDASKRPRAQIIEEHLRHHIMLQPWTEPVVSKALTTLGVQCNGSTGTASGLLSDVVPCGATMTELASITVMPGAQGQNLHEDCSCRPNDSRMISAFVYLQKTDIENGALMVEPGSHRCRHEGSFAFQIPMEPGGVILMNSRTEHGGGPHRGGPRRSVFYFSYAENPDRRMPAGATYALRPELWGQTRVPLGPAGLSSCASDCSTNKSLGHFGLLEYIRAESLVCDMTHLAFALEDMREEVRATDPSRLNEIAKSIQNGTCYHELTCLSSKEWNLLQQPLKKWFDCKQAMVQPIKQWWKDKAERLVGPFY
eukprot:TRINITY_DN21830_c1_g2_i1.p1 TRINITY_DN21830_c1_g2~~TRINITY_DN21830_c1_g2_i1.p1  ORF type:complete len:426 (-),score=59.16 TRINITY_DN21830_c1_g2_i1:74-1351(-)